jgi:hypothetical protein
MTKGNAGIPCRFPPLAIASVAKATFMTPTTRATTMRPTWTQRAPRPSGRTVVSAVITRYAVSSAAGMLIAGATPRTIAMRPPKEHIVSIA